MAGCSSTGRHILVAVVVVPFRFTIVFRRRLVRRRAKREKLAQLGQTRSPLVGPALSEPIDRSLILHDLRHLYRVEYV